MEVKELEELKIGLENQCLILVRQTETLNANLDERKQQLLKITGSIDNKLNQDFKLKQSPLLKKLEEIELKITEKDGVKLSLTEKIKELLVKVDGEKINVVTLLGYYRGIASQIDIEKKKVFAIKKYFEDKSIELKEQIDIESSKLSKTKADNSGFVASLKRQQKLIDDAAKGLAIIQETFDKDTEALMARQNELSIFKDTLNKREARLKRVDSRLSTDKTIIDYNKANSVKILGEAKSKMASAIQYLMGIDKKRDALVKKQYDVNQLKQGILRTKKQFIKREDALSVNEEALSKRLDSFLADASAEKIILEEESLELARLNGAVRLENRNQSNLLGAIKIKVVSIKESYKVSKSRVEKLEEIANKRSKDLSAMVKLANNSLLKIAKKSGLEKEAIKILKDEQKKIQEDFKSQQEVLDTRNSELGKKQDKITEDQIALETMSGSLEVWSEKNEAVEKKLGIRSTKLDSKEKKIDTTLNQATAKLKDIEKDEETTKKNLAQSVSLVENNTVKSQKLKQQQEVVVNDKRELKKREQWLLNDQKKMASDRASLRSAIYEFKRSKK